MSNDATTRASRRRFFGTAGAALSAPLAFAAADGVDARAEAAGSLEARLAERDAVDAVRALSRAYLRHVNAGERDALAALYAEPARDGLDAHVVAIRADAAEPEAIAIAADGATATARIACVVETSTPITPGCTLVEMARAQGEGCVRHAEARVLEHVCVRREGGWKIARSAFLSA